MQIKSYLAGIILSIITLAGCTDRNSNGEKDDFFNNGLSAYLAGNYDSAVYFWEKAYDQAKENDDDLAAAQFQNNIGAVRARQGLYDESLVQYARAIAAYRRIGNEKLLAETLTNASQVILPFHVDSAASYLYEAIEVLEKANDPVSLENAYLSIGNLEHSREVYDKALHYYHMALRLAIENNSESIGTSLQGIGGTYLEMDSIKQASAYLKRALKAKDSLINAGIMKDLYITFYTLGQVQLKEGKYKQAYDNFSRAADHYQSENNTRRLGFALIGQMDAALLMQSREYLNTIAAKLNKTDSLVSKFDSPELKYKYLNTLHRYHMYRQNYREAAELVPDILRVSDRMKNEESSTKVQELTVRYEVNMMKQTIQGQETTIRQNRIIIISILLTALVLGGLGYIFYRNYKKAEQARRAEELAKEEVALQKDQIKHLHQEMYHRVKNNLATFSALLSLEIKRHETNQTADVLREQQNRLAAINSIHQQLYISDEGEGEVAISLNTYLKDLTYNVISNFGYDEVVKVNEDLESLDLNMDRALLLGLLLNEAVNNACKYAVPGHPDPVISISLKKIASGEWILEVADNGEGSVSFPKESNSSLGMKIFSNLSKQLDARWTKSTRHGVCHSWLFIP